MNAKLTIAIRLIAALILIVFGSNKFFGFISVDAPTEGSFMDALIKTGYMIPLIGFSEIAIGVLLLINKWKGLALVWLAPITVNIIFYHLKFDFSTIGPGAVLALTNILLIYANWNKFKTLF